MHIKVQGVEDKARSMEHHLRLPGKEEFLLSLCEPLLYKPSTVYLTPFCFDTLSGDSLRSKY
jgi:hypothetical protein